MERILLLDNNDSYTYNIVDLIRRNHPVQVDVLNSLQCDSSVAEGYKKIIFSPGPGLPDHFPIMKQILSDSQYSDKHILGICLGHQAICEYFGARLLNKPIVEHGLRYKLDIISDTRLLSGVDSSGFVGLYNSWEVDISSVVAPISVTATANGAVMAVEHQSREVYGVQFHPESYMTTYGGEIIKNFIDIK